MKLISAIFIVLLAASPAAAQKDKAGAPAGVKAKSSPARKGAPALPGRELPLTDRIAIQLDLAWTGTYSGLIDGDINEKTIAAIKTFQRDRRFKETGVLNPQERALLSAAAKSRQIQTGWTMVEDEATGARLGWPSKQAAVKSQGKTGTHWSSPQGQVQIETFRIREPGITLAAVHEQQKKEPATRQLWWSVLRHDLFVLAGIQGLKKFYVRAESKDGEVRGVTVLYDQATDTIMDGVAVAMTGTFVGFPALTGAPPTGPPSRRKVEYGSGILVSARGHILTGGQLTDGCNVIVAGRYGDADRLAEDKGTDLALLRIYGVPDLQPASFASAPPKSNELTIVGIADPQSQSGGSAVTTIAAKLKGDVTDPAPQLGFSGAAALDGQGHLVGMVKIDRPNIADPQTTDAHPQATLVPARAILAFLDAHALPSAGARSRVDAVKAAMVRIICVRK